MWQYSAQRHRHRRAQRGPAFRPGYAHGHHPLRRGQLPRDREAREPRRGGPVDGRNGDDGGHLQPAGSLPLRLGALFQPPARSGSRSRGSPPARGGQPCPDQQRTTRPSSSRRAVLRTSPTRTASTPARHSKASGSSSTTWRTPRRATAGPPGGPTSRSSPPPSSADPVPDRHVRPRQASHDSGCLPR